ncbi:hypothetical protein FACS1894176_07100 [Bacteroidia bacterium]|nr:hypothetical protein FACS1894176_07100 [Bacteroidia bacterium]
MKKLAYLSLIGVALLALSFMVFRSNLVEEVILHDLLTIEEVESVVEEPIFEEEFSDLISTDPISDSVEEPESELEDSVDLEHGSEEDTDDNEGAKDEEIFVFEENEMVSAYSTP